MQSRSILISCIPCILETAQKATQNDPKQMQTGPVTCQDQKYSTDASTDACVGQPVDLAEVYALMSQQISQRHS